MIELLSPAGEIGAFKAAIENGADAIYMGVGSYNARIMANNFTKEEYINCIHYAHIRGAKVYLTLNTLLYDSEIKEAVQLVIELYSHGLDAAIVQDIGIFKILKDVLPEIDIHASTQMSVHNINQVKFLEKLGFKRIVLAREMTLEEIKYIRENTKVELEIFIHGALCVSYSGQCLMSSMIGARSGNRGKCAGPCRLKYSMYENGKIIKDNSYLISKKDIFGIDYVNKLIDIGVNSLKIEGRSKTAEYVGLATDKYRKCIDGKFESLDKKELLQMFNRSGEDSGYFESVKTAESITSLSPKNTGLKLGTIILVKDEFVKIKLEENIDMHDGIEIYSSEEVASTIVTCIRDDRFKILNKEANKGEIVWLGDISKKVFIGDEIYKTSSSKLCAMYREKNSKINRKTILDTVINVIHDKNISIEVKLNIFGKQQIVKDYVEYIPQISMNKQVDKDYIDNAFSKTIDAAYKFNITDYNISQGLFVPVSKLNELRRNIIEKVDMLFKTYIDVSKKNIDLDNYIVKHEKEILSINKKYTHENSLFIYEYVDINFEEYIQNSSKIIYLNISDVRKAELKGLDIISKLNDKKEVYIYIPNIVLNNVDKYINENLERIINLGVKGILIGNIGYIEKATKLKEKYGLKLVIDYSLNVLNTYAALFYKNIGIDKITISTEIDECEIKNIAEIIDIEIVENFVTAMTTRFCPVKSYSSGCNCSKNKYTLKDNFNNVRYNIVCDNSDCVVKFVRNISTTENNSYNKRKCIL
ncbi:MAG: U32 family peptidase [Clostridia bacterium]